MMYYIHGYLSSPESSKGRLFKKELNATPINYRDCNPEDLEISDCLQQISKTLKDDQNIVLIGSSLGGFLAASTALQNPNVKKLILLNPAIIKPSTDLSDYDGVPKRILQDMMDIRLFNKKIDAEITILVGTEDDVIPQRWILEFAKAQEANVQFLHDDHMFSKYLTKLPQIISKIINA